MSQVLGSGSPDVSGGWVWTAATESRHGLLLLSQGRWLAWGLTRLFHIEMLILK